MRNLYKVELPILYKVEFQVEFNCGDIISYGSGHTTVAAKSEEDAISKFKSMLRIGSAGWEKLSAAVKILGINPITEFNK